VWVLAVHLEQVLEFIDAFVGERQDAVIAEAIDPDDSVLGLQACGFR